MAEKTLKQKVLELKRSKNALLLVHNYQVREVQEIADFIGDSLELARKAVEVDKNLIVFCGVKFMAETAKILNPQARVLIPRLDAGCPMADMVTPDALKAKLAELSPMPVVTYVNSTAEVKALSTICCTSANVVKVVNDRNGYALYFSRSEIPHHRDPGEIRARRHDAWAWKRHIGLYAYRAGALRAFAAMAPGSAGSMKRTSMPSCGRVWAKRL